MLQRTSALTMISMLKTTRDNSLSPSPLVGSSLSLVVLSTDIMVSADVLGMFWYILIIRSDSECTPLLCIVSCLSTARPGTLYCILSQYS